MNVCNTFTLLQNIGLNNLQDCNVVEIIKPIKYIDRVH